MESDDKTFCIIIAIVGTVYMFSYYCTSKVKIEEFKLQQIIYSNDGVK